MIKREESGQYDSLEPGYHGSIGKNYFVTEWPIGEPGHYNSLEPGNQGSIGNTTLAQSSQERNQDIKIPWNL